MSRRRKRQLIPMICGKCGNDDVKPSEVSGHGVGRCTNANNRPDYCPLCHEDFFSVKEVTLKITDFGQMKKNAAEGVGNGEIVRKTKDVLRRSKWPSKKIYKHLSEHRRMGDTPEDFA